MKMKRIRRLIAVGIAALLLLIVLAVVWIDSLAKAGIEAGATHALGVDTMLGGADVGILAGRSSLSGLNIDNPEGFDSDHFLTLGEGVLEVSLGSLRGDTVEVPEFSLTGIDMNLEKKGGKSNYQVIMDNLSRFESSEDTEAEQGEGKKFIIREIVIKDVKVHIGLLPVGGELTRVTVPIKELRLQNVGTGSDKGLVIAELTTVLVKAIMMAAVEKGGSLIPSDVLGELDSALKSLDPLKDVGATLAVGAEEALEELTEMGSEASEKVEEAAKELTEEGVKAAEKMGEAAKEAADEITKGIGDLLPKEQDKGE